LLARRGPGGEPPRFPAKEWTRTYADHLLETLAAAMENPAPDESGRIVVPAGAILLSGDLPADGGTPSIVLDGGTLCFSPGATALRETVARCEDFLATAPDGEEKTPDVLPVRTEWLASPVFVTERGGHIDLADGEIKAYVTNAVRRAPGTAAATLDVFGFTGLVLDRGGLDPGLAVTGCASLADFLPTGRYVNRRWFDPDDPL
ncbi:MAG: hypothetical protein IJ678_05780, partial [Kiritimatiellae bacterium]|nr:hypothetical protein [Kiritimatiellia bacterium]